MLAVRNNGRLVTFDQAICSTAVVGAAAEHLVQLSGYGYVATPPYCGRAFVRSSMRSSLMRVSMPRLYFFAICDVTRLFRVIVGSGVRAVQERYQILLSEPRCHGRRSPRTDPSPPQCPPPSSGVGSPRFAAGRLYANRRARRGAALRRRPWRTHHDSRRVVPVCRATMRAGCINAASVERGPTPSASWPYAFR